MKLKRDSWQTWDNYALAAAQAHAPTSCVRGMAEVRMLSLLAAGCVLLLLAQGWLSCMILLRGVFKWGVWLVKVFPQVLRDFR